MHGFQQSPSTIIHLWLGIMFFRAVISPHIYQPTDTRILDDFKEKLHIPSEGALASSTMSSHNLEGRGVEIKFNVQSPDEIDPELQDKPQTVIDPGSNSSIDGNNGPVEIEDTKMNSPPQMKIPAIRLSAGLVDTKAQASMIRIEEVFGIRPKKQKENSKNIEKYTTLADKSRGKITPREDKFLRVNVPKDLLATWRKKEFNLKLLFLMATLMRIKKRDNFEGIVSYITPEVYRDLKSIFHTSTSKVWVSMEAEIAKIFEDRSEAKRRILAFRRLLYHHTIAERWAPLAIPLFLSGGRWQDLVMDIQKAYGISAHPQNVVENAAAIPMKKWDLDSVIGPGKLKLRQLLLDVFGDAEVLKRRQELYDYKMNRVGYAGLWCRQPDLYDSQRFGVDILAVWKIGDALQFDSRHLLDKAPGRMSFDSAFAQILQVITANDRFFSWSDSPERAWLLVRYGPVFVERLAKLSDSIVLSDHTNPLSTAAVKGLVGKVGMIEGSYGRGLEIMHWCDLGLDPKEWARIRQIRNSRDQEEIETLYKGMSKISENERKKFLLWHQFVANYDSKIDHPDTIPSKITRNISEWVDQRTTPLKALSQRSWLLLKDKIDRVNPWSFLNRSLNVKPEGVHKRAKTHTQPASIFKRLGRKPPFFKGEIGQVRKSKMD
ncbi:hypothetical protein PGT21_032694 [Puccinia graminis f. sp. tritici]|uniref:Uncharacterized protein n=1 Tax=Puccinia graminis f. sp. tritici TaxID=56615 RepID=A0A5B0LJP0_PUCGR|nr:hypothetical protein PGT21_000430 [Puccinia graminis f. sp. tritici]KAA1119727.1 hypothetical protein PGT21_032694 [Puccinia graminis f. sp. tritici]